MSDQPSGVDEQKAIIAEQPSETATRREQEQRQAVDDFRKGTNELAMKVRIYSPFRDYYEGFVFSLTAENATGPFDILPGHHNFISLLMACELIIRSVEAGELRIRISGGVIHVKANEVVVFLDV